MIETTERFLKEIADRVGAEYVETVHLFPPIRQGGVETGAAVVAASLPLQDRHTVYSASYRNTLKGPERGAWDFEITHEADAPLDTVERVARGVARRSGDEGQPEHLTASDIRATLAQPWWSGAS